MIASFSCVSAAVLCLPDTDKPDWRRGGMLEQLSRMNASDSSVPATSFNFFQAGWAKPDNQLMRCQQVMFTPLESFQQSRGWRKLTFAKITSITSMSQDCNATPPLHSLATGAEQCPRHPQALSLWNHDVYNKYETNSGIKPSSSTILDPDAIHSFASSRTILSLLLNAYHLTYNVYTIYALH
jgi:hypothetical protein